MLNRFKAVNDVCCVCAHTILLKGRADLHDAVYGNAPNGDVRSANIDDFLELPRKALGNNLCSCCFLQRRERSPCTPILLNETTKVVCSFSKDVVDRSEEHTS